MVTTSFFLSYLNHPVFYVELVVSSEVGSFSHPVWSQNGVIKHKFAYLGKIEETKDVFVDRR